MRDNIQAIQAHKIGNIKDETTKIREIFKNFESNLPNYMEVYLAT